MSKETITVTSANINTVSLEGLKSTVTRTSGGKVYTVNVDWTGELLGRMLKAASCWEVKNYYNNAISKGKAKDVTELMVGTTPEKQLEKAQAAFDAGDPVRAGKILDGMTDLRAKIEKAQKEFVNALAKTK